MKSSVFALVASLFCTSSFGDLAGSASRTWSSAPTTNDAAIGQIYSHLSSGKEGYLREPSADRSTAAGSFGATVFGDTRVQIYGLGGSTTATTYFGVRVTIGENWYLLELQGSPTLNHYFTTVNDILAITGGTALADGQAAQLDFALRSVGAFGRKKAVRTHYSASVSPTIFDHTGDLLLPEGPTSARPLPEHYSAARDFLNSGDSWSVFGFEDFFPSIQYDPDYNDFMFAVNLTELGASTYSYPDVPMIMVYVPEPAMTASAGAALLVVIIAMARARRRGQPGATV